MVPSDFSRNADTALRYAVRLSRLTKTEIIVFHCAHLSPYILSSASANDKQLDILTKEDKVFKTKKLYSQVQKVYRYLGVKEIPPSTRILVDSKPLLLSNIIEVALKNNVDLIVTGTHGATGLNRFFFGSNTANMISHSPVPILAVPEKYKFREIRKIAFASDLENLEQELNILTPFAKAVKASIDVVYLDYGTDNPSRIKDATDCIRRMDYHKIKLIGEKASIEYTLIRQLKKYMGKHSYQLLVMFTKERRFWDKLFLGAKTESMSYSLKTPLLSFKKN